VWDGESEKAKCWTLIVTRALGPNADTKVSLTNAPKQTSLRRLGWMQRQRYWIERTFEDGKSECGMADYQVRKWSAWHHHMALVMMAMLFMLTEKIHHKDTYPMLSCADIEHLLTQSQLSPATCCLVNPDKEKTVEKAFASMKHLSKMLKDKYRL
jgi:SRSO17 transposase